MPRIIGFSLITVLLAAGGVAKADAFELYLQGHGGYSGDGSSPGTSVGGEVGARLAAFVGSVGVEDYLDRGTVTRVIIGFGGDVDLGGWRLMGRVGAGLMVETGGVFAGDNQATSGRTGVVGRAGLALDRPIAAGLYVGLAIDAETFALKPQDGVDTGVHTGGDIMGSLHLGFAMGG